MPFQKGCIPWNKGKKCPWSGKNGFKKGQKPWMKGKHHTEEAKERNRHAHLGKKISEETRKKLKEAIARRLKFNPKSMRYWLGRTGEYSAHWKGDKAKKAQYRGDSAYSQWATSVKRRDGNECRLKNNNCSGYKVVHHILPWSDYPDYRYQISNGITLCQTHHPRKKIDEIKLIPKLQKLVEVK